jgi:hypothetical protein
MMNYLNRVEPREAKASLCNVITQGRFFILFSKKNQKLFIKSLRGNEDAKEYEGRCGCNI